MGTHIDVELRVMITGRSHGALEWTLLIVEPDGQVQWTDDGTYRLRPGRELEAPELGEAIIRGLNTCLFRASQAQF